MIDPTYPTLDALPLATRRGLPLDRVLAKAELLRRQRVVQKLVVFFEAKPYVWVPIQELARQFGYGGFRTRISEARRFIWAPQGSQIESGRFPGPVADWRYRFCPHTPLARDASQPVSGDLFTPSEDAPWSRP